MAAHFTPAPVGSLDLSRWRKVPLFAMGAGLLFLVLGLIVEATQHNVDHTLKQFGYSWLVGCMFFLSLCLGGLFLVLVHHLFDASWSVPTRRFCEHLACLA